jgi:hypothetical protein
MMNDDDNVGVDKKSDWIGFGICISFLEINMHLMLIACNVIHS